MPTISRLYPTGVLETTKELDEVTYNSIKVGVDGVYAAQFDETNLDIGTAERRTSDGTYMVSGYFDEYTMVAPAAPSQVVFTTVGNHAWTVPLGVTSVSVVCVGGGAGGGSGGFEGSGISGGGGGGLGWKNNITVVPGETYTVVVGVGGTNTSMNSTVPLTPRPGGAGGDSYFINTSTVKGGGGSVSGTGGTYTGDGGGNGGGSTQGGSGGAGGGAGGYAGAGGTGAAYFGNNGTAGSGGGGGGGATPASSNYGGGGGVGLLGQGSNGAGGLVSGGLVTGGGGSDGGSGSGSSGGLYGGGGAAAQYGYNQTSGAGQKGAVRIIWGSGRAFPSTETVDK
jgi:hypothetical protein